MNNYQLLIRKTRLHKRVFGLVIDFGTSQSPKSTRPLTTYLCPSRPGHPALRNNFASSLLLRTWLPYDWTPRSEAYFVFPLAQGTPGKQCGLAATGDYQPSLRSPWLAAGEVLNKIVSSSESKLRAMSAEEIAAEWWWQWDKKRGVEWNTYAFCKVLEMHKERWRRWKEMHNGSCCVVERVRDKYVMPRVREFLAALDVHRGGHG